MRCEDVRELLPELAEGALREAGEAEQHLATCEACSRDLRSYRALLANMSALRDEVTEPPAGFVERVNEAVQQHRWRTVARRMATDQRVHRAALGVGGAVVGAAAVRFIWRRASRRQPQALGAVLRTG